MTVDANINTADDVTREQQQSSTLRASRAADVETHRIDSVRLFSSTHITVSKVKILDRIRLDRRVHVRIWFLHVGRTCELLLLRIIFAAK